MVAKAHRRVTPLPFLLLAILSIGWIACGARRPDLDADIATLASGPSAQQRAAAVRRLGELGDRAAVESLCRAVGDRESFVRRAAVEALGGVHDVSAAQCLFQIATAAPDNADMAREFDAMLLAGNAAEALGRVGAPAVPLILQGLETPRLHTFVDDKLVRALGVAGDPAGLPKLRRIWAGCQTQLHRTSAEALVAFRDLRPLTDALVAPETEDSDRTDCQRSRRAAAIAALRQATDDRSRLALVGLLGESEGFDLLNVAYSLVGRGEIEPVVEILGDADPVRRRLAARALATSRLHRANAALDRTLAERDLAAVAGGVEYHVRRGRAGSERILLAALEAFGGTEMAIPLADCGNPALVEPATAYLDAHGLERLAGKWLPKGEYRLDVRTFTVSAGAAVPPPESGGPRWGVQ